jgi:hypothetical protein
MMDHAIARVITVYSMVELCSILIPEIFWDQDSPGMGPNRIGNIPVFDMIINFLGSSGMEWGWCQNFVQNHDFITFCVGHHVVSLQLLRKKLVAYKIEMIFFCYLILFVVELEHTTTTSNVLAQLFACDVMSEFVCDNIFTLRQSEYYNHIIQYVPSDMHVSKMLVLLSMSLLIPGISGSRVVGRDGNLGQDIPWSHLLILHETQL